MSELLAKLVGGVAREGREMGGIHAAARSAATRLASASLAAALAATSISATTPLPVAAAEIPALCAGGSGSRAIADDLLANRYHLTPHPVVTLPSDPTWAENPVGDPNWAFQFHSLRFVLSLLSAWAGTGDETYRDRATFLLRDWLQDNPPSDSPSRFSWEGHATAWRGVVYACAADYIGMPTWLHDALVLHGTTLADPDFYVHHGNHALNQSIGLLEVARVLTRDNWATLAGDRINALVAESVDTQGVTNEQSVGYQLYNYRQYGLAKRRMVAVGLKPEGEFARVDLMPRFLAQATLPNGKAEMIGDTEGVSPMPSIPGTWTEFVMSRGASGPTPPLVKAYKAGYLFARSGWGTRRAFRNETYLSIRWGPGRQFHGHPDGTSLTLYGWGSRLILDAGKYSYASSKWRTFFRSRRAHNVVTVSDKPWSLSAPTALVSQAVTSAVVDVRLKATGYAGITQQRRITWSRKLDYILVEDRLASRTSHTYRQLWHLVENSNVAVGKTDVRTRRSKGNVLIRQLVGSPKIGAQAGIKNPVQGWVSYSYGQKVAAPVAYAIRRGSNVRYLTLIVPARGRPRAQVSHLRLTNNGYEVTITIDGRSERVVASGSSISVRPAA